MRRWVSSAPCPSFVENGGETAVREGQEEDARKTRLSVGIQWDFMRLREQRNEQINSTLTHIYFHIHENFCLSLSFTPTHKPRAAEKNLYNQAGGGSNNYTIFWKIVVGKTSLKVLRFFFTDELNFL